jgi:hypothetical protein
MGLMGLMGAVRTFDALNHGLAGVSARPSQLLGKLISCEPFSVAREPRPSILRAPGLSLSKASACAWANHLSLLTFKAGSHLAIAF